MLNKNAFRYWLITILIANLVKYEGFVLSSDISILAALAS